LLDANAAVHVKDITDGTPLSWVARKGHAEVVKRQHNCGCEEPSRWVAAEGGC